MAAAKSVLLAHGQSCSCHPAIRVLHYATILKANQTYKLVAGTCVGIGQGHIGIQDNIYDWVIIDEAARSIASELAIAMQSARRVLLVGDHLQLPPLYSDAHKTALARKLGISSSRTEVDEVLQSDFARAFNSKYGQQASAALLTQYRMARLLVT
ncbi:protein of unknown function [Xenorhabdus nematophila AN6/1]|nr:AAA domain-containing protein [Xenorhabdus nematophila]CEK24486.1 protein of unknown function [Xenorhabdus nematophila AN6/1]